MRNWSISIDQGLLRVAMRRLAANIALVIVIAMLLPFLHATPEEVFWVVALCVGVMVLEEGIKLLIASAKMARIINASVASGQSGAPRSRRVRLR